MRVKVTLRCNECKQRNYNTMKNKKNSPDRDVYKRQGDENAYDQVNGVPGIIIEYPGVNRYQIRSEERPCRERV